MQFIQHSIEWAKGEIFESSITGGAGLLLIALALVFWKFGQTPGAKAMLIPLGLTGMLLAFSGVSGYNSNQKRIEEYKAVDPTELVDFVKSEKERVEGFESLYTFTMVFAALCFAAACTIFWLTSNPHWRAAAIALVVLGSAGLIIDSFSKERADVYYGEILRALSGVSVP